MSSEPELFSFIRSLEEAGQVESDGQFTIGQAEAWEKLAALSLPFKGAWVLKIVQSCMSHDEPLHVTQGRTDSIFRWCAGTADWTPALIEQAIFSLEPSQDKALHHLAVGLRALAKTTDLPFALTFPNGTVAFWNGSQFVYQESDDGPRHTSLSLNVSHFKVGESGSVFSLDNFAAKKRAAQIQGTLADFSQFAPREVSLDGRNLSNLFNDPIFGPSESAQPLFVLRAAPHEHLPSLRVLGSFARPSIAVNGPSFRVDEAAVNDTLREFSQPSFAIAMVSAFLVKRKSGKTETFESRSQSSALVWVADGVEVAREFIVSSNSVAILIVCSADGLETDLSGLVPRGTLEKEHRKKEVLRAITREFQLLTGADPDTQATFPRETLVVAGLAFLGLVTFVMNPVVGFFIAGISGFNHLSSKKRVEEVERSADEGLRKLLRMLAEENNG